MKRNSLILAIVAVIVVIVIVAAAYVLLAAPRTKLQMELWYNSDGHYGDTEPQLATVLKNSIEKSSKVSVTLHSDPWAVYRQNWVNERMPLFLLGWYPDYFDTDDYISPFLSVSGAASLGSFYNNSQVDAWVTQEQSTTDPVARQALMEQIQDKLAEDVPYVPLFSGNAQVAYLDNITNVFLHPVTFKWFIIDKPGATELKGATTDNIISLDPASAYDFFSIEVINQVFDTLLVYDVINATLMPGLATEVPSVANGGISANGQTYTYHLRTGVTFHDGTAFNSSVVKRAIDRAIRLDIPGSAAFLLYDVGGLGRSAANGNNTAPGVITTPDANTIVFNLNKPLGFFNDLMAFSAAAPVPWTYSQTGEQPSTVPNVIGTGPYRLTTHQADTLVVLDSYAGYYGTTLYAPAVASIPKVPRVSIDLVGSATNLKQSIETKQVDVAFRTLTPTDLSDLQNRASTLGLKVDIGASPQIRYLVFNVNLVPDVRVRRAIAYLVDRPLIDSQVFQGLVEPLYSMVPPNMPFAKAVFQTAYGNGNVAAADNILAGLGYAIQFRQHEIAREIG